MNLTNEELIELFILFKERYLEHSKKRGWKTYEREIELYNEEIGLLNVNNIYLKDEYLHTPNMSIYIDKFSTYNDFIEMKRIKKIKMREQKLRDLGL
jgi:hypothetical protein